MATIRNERDIQLQSTTPRLLSVSTNYISIVPSTNTFTTTSSGIVPTAISIKAFKNGILAGTIAWSTSPTTSYSTITDGISVNGTDIPIGTSVTFTASLTYLGVLYSSSIVVTRAANSSIITLEQTAANINKSSTGIFSPSTVVFSGKVVDGANPPSAYAGRFVVDSSTDGISYTNLYNSSINESSYTYTPDISHKAVRVKLYAAGGIVTLLDQKTTSISESGVGADGNIIYLSPSSYVLAKNQNNSFSPTSIMFTGKTKTGTAVATNYFGRFRIYENGSVTPSYTSVANESSTTYTPSASCISLKCELFLAGGFTSKVDEQGVTISLSGSNAINTVLTNEAHVLPSDSAGAITSYAGSGTQLYVYEGGTVIPFDEAGYTAGNPNTWKVITTTSNITVGTKTDNGTYVDFGILSGVSSVTDTSSITFTISGRTSIGVAFSVVKTQKFAKSKQGLQGPAGPADTSNLLKLDSANILTGATDVQSSGGIKTGTIAWNTSTGVITSGSGIAITKNGLTGAVSGTPTFTITAAGAATFYGNITGGANIDINGSAIFNGASSAGGLSAAVVANSSGTQGVGVVGKGSSGGMGLRGIGGLVGVKAEASGFGAIALSAVASSSAIGASITGDFYLNGAFHTTSSALVTYLNADMLDGYHATSFCAIVPTNSGTCTVGGAGFNLMVTGALSSSIQTRGTSNYVYIESISDERLKQDIQDEEYGLPFINSLQPRSYRLKSDPKLIRHGFIAQELDRCQSIADDSLATPNPNGIWGVDYNGLSAPIVRAIQELHQEVIQLKERIKILENK